MPARHKIAPKIPGTNVNSTRFLSRSIHMCADIAGGGSVLAKGDKLDTTASADAAHLTPLLARPGGVVSRPGP